MSLSEGEDDNINIVGVVELNGSINYVESKGDYIFAASGKEGLQIIKLNRPDVGLEAKCSSVPAYPQWGSSWLNVDSGVTLAYSGSKRFNSISVNGDLLLWQL